MILMTNAKKNSIKCAGIFLCALFTVGCGGGGGGTAGGGGSLGPCEFDMAGSPACIQEFANLRGTAATTVPTAGGQSSNPNTIDASIEVFSSGVGLSVSVSRANSSATLTVLTEIPNFLRGDPRIRGNPSARDRPHVIETATNTVTIQILEFYSQTGFPDTGGVIIHGITDYQRPEAPAAGSGAARPTSIPLDSDYMVIGYWGLLSDSDTVRHETGVFVDGNDQFVNIRPAMGDAIYRGAAKGIFDHNECNGCVLRGDVTLTARFQGGNDLGSISGAITDIFVRDAADTYGISLRAEPLTLDTAMINEEGFYSGKTSFNYRGSSEFTGEWGGKFFGTPAPGDPAGTVPGSAAGTFGGKLGDSSFLGYFLTYEVP